MTSAMGRLRGAFLFLSMPTKSTPEIRVIAFPRSAISKRTTEGLIVADRIAAMSFPGAGDYRSNLAEAVQSQNPTISLDWAATPVFDVLSNLGMARFKKDGTVVFGPSAPENGRDTAVAGVFIQPREAPLDCKIGDNAAFADSGFTDISWLEKEGTFKTMPALVPGGGTGIFNIGGDELSIAETAGVLPAKRSMRFDLFFQSKARGGPNPRFRLIWGGKYSIVFEHGAAPTIERRIDGGAWTIWKTVHGFEPLNLLGGRYRVYIERLAGRLVVRIGNASIWLLDDKSGAASGFIDVDWPEAPLTVNIYNCRVHLEMAVVKWSSANGQGYTAQIGRMVPRRTPIDPDTLTVASSGGWKLAGTAITVAPTIEQGGVRYLATLAASADGIDTPFLQTVLIKYRSDWSAPDATGVNLSSAVNRAKISLALPPVLAGSECTLDLDFGLLRKLSGWQNVIRARCPLEVSIRWKYTDGTASNWSKVFVGYVFMPGQDIPGYNGAAVRIVGRDPIMRLQKPAGVIDHRFGPMEMVFLEKFAGGSGGYDVNTGRPIDGKLWSGECVREILRVIMGDGVAASINGNGDPRRFASSLEPPLYAPASDAGGYLGIASAFGLSLESAPSLLAGNFIFPPPFGDDGLSWINRFTKDAFSIFCWGWPTGDTTVAPVPIIGDYLRIVANRKLVKLYDAKVNGDTSRLISRFGVEARPQKTINRWLVWGNLNGQNALEGLTPAMVMAEARLYPGDLDSAEESWELTEIIQNDIAAIGDVPGRRAAEAIAFARRDLARNIRLEWPSFTMPQGDETIQSGDVVQPILTGENASLGLYGASINGARFRSELIEHLIEPNVSFETTIFARPLSPLERNRAAANMPANDDDNAGGYVDVDLLEFE
jgi:hypothetical protein